MTDLARLKRMSLYMACHMLLTDDHDVKLKARLHGLASHLIQHSLDADVAEEVAASDDALHAGLNEARALLPNLMFFLHLKLHLPLLLHPDGLFQLQVQLLHCLCDKRKALYVSVWFS